MIYELISKHFTLHNRSIVIAVIATIAALTVRDADAAEPVTGTMADFEHCHTMTDNAARLRCFKSAADNQIQNSKSTSEMIGAWRLVRTPDARGGADIVSITRTAEMTRSDPKLAGLMLRCGEKGIEVLVVLLQTLRPSALPKVTVTSDGTDRRRFEGAMVPPYATIRLPNEAATLANGPWTSVSEISIEVENDKETIRGVIPVQGLRQALNALKPNCQLK